MSDPGCADSVPAPWAAVGAGRRLRRRGRRSGTAPGRRRRRARWRGSRWAQERPDRARGREAGAKTGHGGGLEARRRAAPQRLVTAGHEGQEAQHRGHAGGRGGALEQPREADEGQAAHEHRQRDDDRAGQVDLRGQRREDDGHEAEERTDLHDAVVAHSIGEDAEGRREHQLGDEEERREDGHANGPTCRAAVLGQVGQEEHEQRPVSPVAKRRVNVATVTAQMLRSMDAEAYPLGAADMLRAVSEPRAACRRSSRSPRSALGHGRSASGRAPTSSAPPSRTPAGASRMPAPRSACRRPGRPTLSWTAGFITARSSPCPHGSTSRPRRAPRSPSSSQPAPGRRTRCLASLAASPRPTHRSSWWRPVASRRRVACDELVSTATPFSAGEALQAALRRSSGELIVVLARRYVPAATSWRRSRPPWPIPMSRSWATRASLRGPAPLPRGAAGRRRGAAGRLLRVPPR